MVNAGAVMNISSGRFIFAQAADAAEAAEAAEMYNP